MKKTLLIASYCLLVAFFSGCVVRTYSVTKERPDQNLNSGNKGYVEGKQPASSLPKERNTLRTTKIVEVELYPPIKIEKTKKKSRTAKKIIPQQFESEESTGNKGYLTESYSPEILEPVEIIMEKYTVLKNDTLQKIAKKFYGKANDWVKIYDANKDSLKAADKIFAGQVLNIPVEVKQQPKSNTHIGSISEKKKPAVEVNTENLK